jgi:hypothetical protein
MRIRSRQHQLALFMAQEQLNHAICAGQWSHGLDPTRVSLTLLLACSSWQSCDLGLSRRG